MPLSTDVNLPRDHTPRFPDKCIRCGRGIPSTTVKITTRSIGWWTAMFMFGRRFSVRAPACRACDGRLRLQRVGSLVGTIGMVAVCIFFIWPLVPESWPKLIRKFVMLAAAMVALSPQIFYEVFFPPVFDMTAYKNSVDYEFRDPELASEFAALNSEAEWVKVE